MQRSRLQRQSRPSGASPYIAGTQKVEEGGKVGDTQNKRQMMLDECDQKRARSSSRITAPQIFHRRCSGRQLFVFCRTPHHKNPIACASSMLSSSRIPVSRPQQPYRRMSLTHLSVFRPAMCAMDPTADLFHASGVAEASRSSLAAACEGRTARGTCTTSGCTWREKRGSY